MPGLPKRKNIRLANYDYSSNGAYFITICTKDKKNILWDDNGLVAPELVGASIASPPFELSKTGILVDDAIKNIENIYENVCIDNYAIMPNHIHLLIILQNDNAENAGSQCSPLHRQNNIKSLISQLKGRVTKQAGCPIWQKSFYDHIIRDEAEYQSVWQYIKDNPPKWRLDRYYTA